MQTNDPALSKTHVDNNGRAGGNDIVHDDAHHLVSNHDELEDNTTINKGTDTFEDNIVETKHVNDGDNPARQPDRRDQQGSSAFDGGINDETMGSTAPKSEALNDMNRYSSVDNAQTRILNPDEKD